MSKPAKEICLPANANLLDLLSIVIAERIGKFLSEANGLKELVKLP